MIIIYSYICKRNNEWMKKNSFWWNDGTSHSHKEMKQVIRICSNEWMMNKVDILNDGEQFFFHSFDRILCVCQTFRWFDDCVGKFNKSNIHIRFNDSIYHFSLFFFSLLTKWNDSLQMEPWSQIITNDAEQNKSTITPGKHWKTIENCKSSLKTMLRNTQNAQIFKTVWIAIVTTKTQSLITS